MTEICKKSDWSCPYHACLSDDCQRKVVVAEGNNLGRAHCEPREVITKINRRFGRIWVWVTNVDDNDRSRKYLLADFGTDPVPEDYKSIIGMGTMEAVEFLKRSSICRR